MSVGAGSRSCGCASPGCPGAAQPQGPGCPRGTSPPPRTRVCAHDLTQALVPLRLPWFLVVQQRPCEQLTAGNWGPESSGVRADAQQVSVHENKGPSRVPSGFCQFPRDSAGPFGFRCRLEPACTRWLRTAQLTQGERSGTRVLLSDFEARAFLRGIWPSGREPCASTGSLRSPAQLGARGARSRGERARLSRWGRRGDLSLPLFHV